MDAIFQPPKSKTANLEKRDYLGKSQVIMTIFLEKLMISMTRGIFGVGGVFTKQAVKICARLKIT